MVEVVDLTLTDDEDDVAVDNRDEEVVEVVVNREVRGAAGAANRVDDDDEVMRFEVTEEDLQRKEMLDESVAMAVNDTLAAADALPITSISRGKR